MRTEGIRAAVLRASVPTQKREAWYQEQLRRGIDVAIATPSWSTGLDLLDFPAILFYETGYSLHTLRQASRRSWRIGQRRPVEVKFFAYSETMQEVCIRLMGKKLLVALAMEGKFASDGLQAIDGDDDMLTAMARELVENRGIGESADEIWRAVGGFQPAGSIPAEDDAPDPIATPIDSEVTETLPFPLEPAVSNSALVEAARMPRRTSRRAERVGQLSLF